MVKNRESAEEIERLKALDAGRNSEINSLQSKVACLSQMVDELNTKNASLMYRAELMSANKE